MQPQRNYQGQALGDNPRDHDSIEFIIQGPIKVLLWIVCSAIAAFAGWAWIWILYFLLGGQ